MRWRPMASRRAPRRWSTKTSVSRRRSATDPLIPTRSRGVGNAAEGGAQRCVGVWAGGLEVLVESPADNFGEGQSFRLDNLIDAAPLGLGEINLRAGGRHTAQ